MPEVEFRGETYLTDEEGFLRSYNDWNENWVDYVAKRESMGDITDDHLYLVKVLQDYYEKNGVPPMVRVMAKATGFKLKRIWELFPSGPGKGACKMAGLPKPIGCV